MASEHLKVILGLDAGPFKDGLDRSGAAVQGFAGKVNNLLSGPIGRLAGFFGVGLSAGALAGAFKNLTNLADHLDSVSTSAGVSVEKLQAFRYMVSQNGGSAEDATDSIQRFNRRIGASADSANAASTFFGKWGIAIKDTNGQIRDTESVLKDALDLIKKTPDSAIRAQIAFDLFGDSGFKMVKALKLGGDELDNVTKSLVDQSQVITRENITALTNFKSAADAAFESMKNLAGNGAGQIASVGFGIGQIGESIRGGDAGGIIGNIGSFLANRAPTTRVIETTQELIRSLAELGVQELDTTQALERLRGRNSAADLEAREKAIEDLKAASEAYFATQRTAEQKLSGLVKERHDLQVSFFASEDGSVRQAQLRVQLLNNEVALAKQRNEVEAEAAKQAAERRSIEERLANARDSLTDRSRLTKDQLREFDLSKVADPQMRAKIAAQRANLLIADRLRGQAEIATSRGMFDHASGLRIQADRREMNLTLLKNSERTMGDLAKTLPQLEKAVAEFSRMASDEGINLKAIKMR